MCRRAAYEESILTTGSNQSTVFNNESKLLKNMGNLKQLLLVFNKTDGIDKMTDQ